MESITNKKLAELLESTKSATVPGEAKEPRDHLRSIYNVWHNHKPETEEVFLKLWVHQIMSSASEVGGFARILGQLCRYRISTILQIVAQEETQSPFFVRISLTPGNLTLPEAFYPKGDAQNSIIWESYLRYVGQCAHDLNMPFLLEAIEGEKALAKIMSRPFTHLTRNLRGASLSRWETSFDWDMFWNGWGLDAAWHKRQILLDAPERIKRILHWVHSAPKEQVVAVLSLHLITLIAPYLNTSTQKAAENLFLKSMRGIEKPLPKEKRFLEDVKAILPDALCSIYAEEQKKPERMRDITGLVEGLRKSAIEIMANTDIFGKKTRSAAIEKIHRMHFEIGSANIEQLEGVTYDPESILHTIMSINEMRSKELMRITGRGMDRRKTSYPCYVSNASYYPESNHIMLPYGILQWPFYCHTAEVAWNYGAIGSIIGHELTHAFDLDGSEYNPRAVYKHWWTRKNRNGFKKRTQKVSKFYSKFRRYGMTLRGTNTLSEDWADLGGLTISLNALKKHLKSSGASDAVTKEAIRTFFIAYAVSWRIQMRKRKALYALMTSVHSLAEDRVDRIVPNFQEWVDAFGIKETDPLYLSVSKRLKFF